MFKNRLPIVVVALVATLASNVAAPLAASPVEGLKYDIHRVAALSSDVFVLRFTGGEPAVVAVVGDGDTDLDLFVYDENGNLIGKDDDATDTCLVNFVPRWSGPFRIVVQNLGLVYNEYRIGAG